MEHEKQVALEKCKEDRGTIHELSIELHSAKLAESTLIRRIQVTSRGVGSRVGCRVGCRIHCTAYTLNNVLFTLYSVCCIFYAVRSMMYTVYSIQCTLYIACCIPYITHTVYSRLYIVHSVHDIVSIYHL